MLILLLHLHAQQVVYSWPPAGNWRRGACGEPMQDAAVPALLLGNGTATSLQCNFNQTC
jgi:hypothetical protein